MTRASKWPVLTLSCASGCCRVSRMNKRRAHPRKSVGKRVLAKGKLQAERRKKHSDPHSPPGRRARISLRLAHPNFTNQTFACGRREELVCFLASEFPRFSSFPLRLQKFTFAYSALRCYLPAYYLADIPHPNTSNTTHQTTTNNSFAHLPY